ncbi:hypothetical protein DNTS_028958 [Danionella cerebrum]|uniref:Uncharacterized protein n=1 Tax=Danionella cerebrum TaxID=2873325 RepID=A0A553RAM5_9TELE|nr:hypothetical protein DNTS_028958 [Danionella translucida]
MEISSGKNRQDPHSTLGDTEQDGGMLKSLAPPLVLKNYLGEPHLITIEDVYDGAEKINDYIILNHLVPVEFQLWCIDDLHHQR